jgi:threonine dehydrogenase-like Zn-dependent dehydrogenase
MTVSVNFVPEVQLSQAAGANDVAGLARTIRRAQIALGEQVVVVGDTPRARLAADLAGSAGASSVRLVELAALNEAPSRSADVVLYALGEARWLSQALRLTRDRGRVLLLGPVGAVDLDMYPDLRQRSIRLIGARSPDEPSPQTVGLAGHLPGTGRLRPANLAGQPR